MLVLFWKIFGKRDKFDIKVLQNDTLIILIIPRIILNVILYKSRILFRKKINFQYCIILVLTFCGKI